MGAGSSLPSWKQRIGYWDWIDWYWGERKQKRWVPAMKEKKNWRGPSGHILDI